MPKTQWIVLIDWIDGEIEDSDEVLVSASSAAAAVKEAVQEWGRVTTSRYPHCMMLDANILTRQTIEGFA